MNIIKGLALGFILLAGTNVYGQQNNRELKAVLSADSTFWGHFNSCNVEAMRPFFSDDLEFYHDKGGITNGLESFLAVSKRNLCSNDNFRLRKEAVAGSIEIFPMENNGALYGAILSGQHVFYILEKGKEPQLDGLARFSHLWLKTESGWKMSRILSYDHGPASRLKEQPKAKK